MLVVSDTSPIHYLILIGQINLLSHLYGRILIPGAVFEELTHPATPKEVRSWMIKRVAWLEVVPVRRPMEVSNLDPGESEALALAVEWGAVPDAAGRTKVAPAPAVYSVV